MVGENEGEVSVIGKYIDGWGEKEKRRKYKGKEGVTLAASVVIFVT